MQPWLVRQDNRPIAVAMLAALSFLGFVWGYAAQITLEEKLTITAVIVSALGIMLSFWQSERNRKKQFRIEFLVRAYQVLEAVGNRYYEQCSWYRGLENKWALSLEEAVRDMQLMGSAEVAGLSRLLTMFPTNSDDYNNTYGKLLLTLRNELRLEIGESLIFEEPRSLRHVYIGPALHGQ